MLIVEDHTELQELIGLYLELQGMIVWTADSCSEALSILEQFRPDFIITDIKLADGDAYSLLRQWRIRESKHGWETIPAIAISGLDWFDHEPLARAAGFQAYIVKPFDPKRLLAVIDLVLSSRKKRG